MTLGILGGGQLGRMTALAAIPMGIRVRFLVPRFESSIEGLGEMVIGDWTNPDVLAEFASGCDTVTVESEWAPADLLEPVLPEGTTLFPSPETLRIIRDKGRQKTMLRDAGLPVPPLAVPRSLEDAKREASALGYPLVAKKLRGSYDGYGNATVRNENELVDVWKNLADENGLLLEAFVDFKQELTILVARGANGEFVIYPIAYTEQRDHRCHAVEVPASVSLATASSAQMLALAAVEVVDGTGITAVELFETNDGRILINELAPRPHNTGHYSIEACHTSQFENHVRAVLGLPLGDPALRVDAACMVNILGKREGTPRFDGYEEALAFPGVSVHIYGKDAVREKRKMGHVTATGTDPVDVRRRAERAAELINL